MKQVQIHGEPSFYRKHGKDMAQVTVLVGEGAKQRSETRHAEFKGGRWVGLNTDRRAIPLNALYTAELLAAKADLSEAKRELTSLQEKLVELETAVPMEPVVDATTLGEMKEELVEAISNAQAFVEFAEKEVVDAETRLAIVERELPLQVQFV